VTTARKILITGIAAVFLFSMGGTGFAKTFSVKAQGNDTWKKLHTYIGKGDSVRWKNPDSEVHDVTAYSGRWKASATLNPGDSFKKRFKKKGTFGYRCAIHSGIVDGKCQGMCGLIHVV
jgi:plastocyanin